MEIEYDDDTMSDESDDMANSSASENDDDVEYEQRTEDRGRALSLSGDFCRIAQIFGAKAPYYGIVSRPEPYATERTFSTLTRNEYMILG